MQNSSERKRKEKRQKQMKNEGNLYVNELFINYFDVFSFKLTEISIKHNLQAFLMNWSI